MKQNNVSRNRLMNARNEFQGLAKRVLCVCSAGVLRSPTLAEVLSRDPFNFNTRSCGHSRDFALVVLDEALLTWADEVVVMDNYQAGVVNGLQDALSDQDRGFCHYLRKPVHVFDVPDDYEFRDPELVRLLTEKSMACFANECTN